MEDIGHDSREREKRKKESREFDEVDMPGFGKTGKTAASDTKQRKSDILREGEGIVSKTANTIRRADRSIDRIFDKDYNQYRNMRMGKTELNQFSTKELKYLARDRAIEGKDTSDIKQLMVQRKFDAKAFQLQHGITTTHTIRTEKGAIRVGTDRSGERYLSTSDYRDSPTIRNWERLDGNNLATHIKEQGGAARIEVTDHTRGKDSKLSIAREQVDSIRNDLVQNLRQVDLPDTKFSFNGKERDNVESLVKVMREKVKEDRATDKDNARDPRTGTVAKALIDGRHLYGTDADGSPKIGTVKSDNSITWKTKEEFVKGMSPDERKAFEQRLNNRVSHIRKIGSARGIDLYAGRTVNNENVLTANKDTWVKVKSAIGSQLLSLAGFDNFAVAMKMGKDAATDRKAEITSKPVYEHRNNNQINI